MRWLWITLGVLVLLVVAIARTRVGVRAVLGGEQTTVDAAVGPFRIRIIPRKPKKKPEEPPRQAEAPKQKKKQKAPAKEKKALPKITLADVRSAADALLPALKKALRRTRRSIRISPLDLSVTVGGANDPAAAAETYGYLHMAVWTGMPALEQLLVIPDPHIHLGVDFDAPGMRLEGKVGISIRIGTIFAVAFGIAVPALRWFLRFRKKNGQQPPSAPAQKPETERTAA